MGFKSLPQAWQFLLGGNIKASFHGFTSGEDAGQGLASIEDRSLTLCVADRDRFGGGEQRCGFAVAVAFGAGFTHGDYLSACVSAGRIALVCLTLETASCHC